MSGRAVIELCEATYFDDYMTNLRPAFLRIVIFRPQIFVSQFFASHFFVSQIFVSSANSRLQILVRKYSSANLRPQSFVRRPSYRKSSSSHFPQMFVHRASSADLRIANLRLLISSYRKSSYTQIFSRTRLRLRV